MRTSIALLVGLALSAAVPAAQTRTADTLDIYLIDVEGGAATLFVSPSGESLLIDTGYPRSYFARKGRDAERIIAAVNDAGLRQIDHLIITHYHGDHFGGVADLAERIPIRHFIDHGATVQPERLDAARKHYADLSGKAKHTIVKPGDKIPVAGLNVQVVTSAGQVLQSPLPGAGLPNPYCASFEPRAVDTGENARSVGTHITFGEFRTLHLGDLTWNKEFDLMCPNNPIGTVDVFVVSHHGLSSSNAPVLVHAIQPRVAIMNNGTRKGGEPDAMKVLFSAPGLENLWQLHFSLLGGQEYTVPGIFIANPIDEQPPTMPVAPTPMPPGGVGNRPPAPAHDGPAYWIKVSAQQDGTFTVTNARNGFSKTYRGASGTN